MAISWLVIMPKKKTAGKKGSGKKKAPLTGEELLMLAKHEEQRVMARQELAVQFLKVQTTAWEPCPWGFCVYVGRPSPFVLSCWCCLWLI